MISLIYTISIIAVFILAIVIKKSEEKIGIIEAVTFNFVLLLSYNAFICYILNLIHVQITLLPLTIINIFICILMAIKIYKDKVVQKYSLKKENIIVLLILLVVTVTIMNINFGNLTKIRYISMDAREHYRVATDFFEKNTLSRSFMFMGYANVGIIFKILNPFIGTVELYKVYILFEAFIYLLTGFIFYILVEKFCKKINSKIIAIIFCIIYMLGYPLNAWISGFHYLLIGILFVEAIMYIHNKNEFEFGTRLIILFFLNFGLILSYSLFCPFVYLAEFIYYCYEYTKDKEKIKLFLLVFTTLIIPGIIGVMYLIVPALCNVGDYIAQEGWVYKNVWSNYILFIPFTIYEIYKNVKNKEGKFESLIFALLLIYMLILFVGTKIGRCSEYYFYKNYFILWLLLVYFSLTGMIQFIENKKAKFVVNIYTIIYIIIFLVSIYYQKTYIKQTANDSLKATMEIFTFNNTMINAKNDGFITKEELELLKQFENVIDDEWQKYDNILFVTDPTQERWIESLTGFKNILYDDKEYAIQNLKDENYKYIITFENRDMYEDIEQYINTENMKLLYENSIGKIYEKNE
jgi:hypothetical protein